MTWKEGADIFEREWGVVGLGVEWEERERESVGENV